MSNTQLDEEGVAFLSKDDAHKTHKPYPITVSRLLFVASCLLNVLLMTLLFRRDTCNSLCSQILYSPAQGAIQYKVEKFHRGFGHEKTIYQQDPSPEVDDAWRKLYNDVGIIRLPRQEAEKLPNKTYPYVGDEGYYIAELAVFHQLHCINAIRIALAKEYYQSLFEEIEFDPENGSYGRDHISHCVDAIREAVMCAADISVITWAWNERAQKALGHGDIVHSCRNFDHIWEWSFNHAAATEFNGTVFVEDDLKILAP